MTNAKEIATESKTAKFEVGKNYYANFYTAGFAEVAEKNTVIKRTAKTVTFQNDKTGETFKRNIRMSCGGEVCKAYGKFLVLRADQCIEENIEAEIEDYAVKPEAFDIAVECEIENAKATEVETKKASRKVITRDDLNSFCFRLEKVSNGQFGALVEVQKKAVALLGTEIPESVYKADNSYHAFHIWLGSEINPVIVYSDGNKDEIRVCGDAYGFVAVKEETPEEKPAEVEKTSDNANEKKYIGRKNHKYAVHYHLTDEDGYSESGEFFCDDLKVAFAKCTEYGKNILGKDGHAFIKTDVVIYVRYGHGGECVMVEEGANIIRELIKERDAKTVAGYNFDTELDTEIDDAIFAEVEKINAEVKSIAECAAVSEGGDLTIEGKIVSMPDKKGKLRYYSYRFDNGGKNQYETSLEVISENRAREIARDWSIEHGYITFDDFMAASNAEYKKIRSLYIKAGGWLLRQYDIDLANELTTAENPEYVLKEFREWQKSLKQFITAKNFHFAETAKEEVIKYRQKLLQMKNAA